MKKIRHSFIYLALFVASIAFCLSIYYLNDKIFFERIIIEKFTHDYDAGLLVPPKAGETVIIDGQIKTPWYSVLFWTSTISLYWFSFGYIFCKKLKPHKLRYLLIYPIFVGGIFLDFYLPIYCLFCYLGGKLSWRA